MNAILRVLMTLPVPAMVLFKMTILLGLGWVLHFALIRSNPRWRALLWRMVMVCVVLLVPAQLFLPELPLFVIKEAQKISAPANPLPAPLPVAPLELQTPAEPLIQPDNILPPIPPKSQISMAALLDSLTRNWPALLAIAWAALALILSIRHLYTYSRLSQFIKSANPAPESILATAKQVASQLERMELPRLRVANDLASPFAAGFLRPVIVIPKTLADEKYRPNLVAVLAHELVHIKSRDLFWMAFAHALSILLWFHPLMWRMRHAHNMACEQVCDGVAAEISGGAPTYSQTLAQTFLTLVVDAPQPMGAPMLRPSEIMRRIAILKLGLQVNSLKWSWVGLACLAAIMVLTGLGGLTLAEREQQIRSWFAGYIHGADPSRKDSISPNKLEWNDIPILLELAKNRELLKRSEGDKIPCSRASSYGQREGITGMVALWLIEIMRGHELTPPIPSAEYGGIALCPFCLKYGQDVESCEKSEEIHQEALAAYTKWWQEAKSLPKAEAAKRDPLAHTDIPWYGRSSKYLRFRWVATESERGKADLFSPQDYSEKSWLLKDALFTESDIASAEAQPSAVADKYQILLRFNDDAGKRFAQVTEQNIGRQLAIVFKGNILMVPIIRAAIPDARVVVGSFYKEQAETIAKAINDLETTPAAGNSAVQSLAGDHFDYANVIDEAEVSSHRLDILRRIHEIRLLCDDKSVATTRIEQGFLAIVSSCKTNDEKALVFSALVNVFAAHIIRVDRAKSEEYSRRILGLKIDDPEMVAKAYATIGSSICLSHRGAHGEELACVRKEATAYHLKAIRILLDNGIGTKLVPVSDSPGFVMILPNPDPEKEHKRIEELAKYQQAVDKVAKEKQYNNLVDHRKEITKIVVFNYQMLPFATEELRQMAMEILQDKEAVNEIIAAVNEAVERDKKDRDKGQGQGTGTGKQSIAAARMRERREKNERNSAGSDRVAGSGDGLFQDGHPPWTGLALALHADSKQPALARACWAHGGGLSPAG